VSVTPSIGELAHHATKFRLELEDAKWRIRELEAKVVALRGEARIWKSLVLPSRREA